MRKIDTDFVASAAVAMNHKETLWFAIRHTQFKGVDIYFIEYNDFFDREGLYGEQGQGYGDNSRRFAFFCKAALELCQVIEFQPDVIHCHDWQAALLPYYLKVEQCHNAFFKQTGTLLTLHNAAYQQQTSADQLDSLGIGWRYFNEVCFEDFGQINLLKGGIAFADRINAVSSSYSAELLTEPGSHGLFESFQRRKNDLSGILNGCDYDQWNPEHDPLIPANYSAADLTGKSGCKLALQDKSGLPVDKAIPVYGVVSRLAEQKGFGYLIPALWEFLQREVQVVILGSGEESIASELHRLAHHFPDKCRFYHGFDNGLAHQIEAGADFFLMPSLFEPCGLNQIYSLKYGTLPVVRRVGGLRDTVECYETHGLQGTGFGFERADPEALLDSLKHSLTVYHDSGHLQQMQVNAMVRNFDWKRAAEHYCAVYQSISQ